jgi:hypothetical protein
MMISNVLNGNPKRQNDLGEWFGMAAGTVLVTLAFMLVR